MEYGQLQAEKLGIKEEDVDRLIHEWRQAQRGRQVRRVTADSNIWISGLIWRGKPHELLNLARAGKIELAVSDTILDEFTGVLRDTFEWSPERLSALRGEIATFT